MADEYKNENIDENEEWNENHMEEQERDSNGTSDITESTISQENGVNEGFCFEEQHSDAVDTSYRQPKPNLETEQEFHEESFTSYGDAMQANLEEMKNEPIPPFKKLSRKEKKTVKER